MLNKTTIIGNLGNDPELRYTPQGDAVTSFSVATNRRWGSGDSKGEETVWFRVSVWGRQAEACNQWLEKGRQVYVEGRLVPDRETGGPRIWTDNNGNPRSSFEIRALQVQFLQGGSDSGNSQGGYSQGQAGQGYQSDTEEDSIPF